MGQLTLTTAEIQDRLNGIHTYIEGSHIDYNIMRVNNSNPLRAPFRLSIGDHNFAGTEDFWMLFGYNIGWDGLRILGSEPALSWNMEASYLSGSELFEYYLQWQSPHGIGWARLLEFQWDKVTGELSIVRHTAPTITFGTWETGTQQMFATLGASTPAGVVTHPEFKIYGLTNQTGDSLISATAGNSKQAKLKVSNGTQIGYFATVVAGLNISETSGGIISFSTAGKSLSLTIRNNGDLALDAKLIQTELIGALTDGAPTDTEIDTITGTTPAAVGAGWQCTIKDNTGSGLLYRIESDGTNWFYSVMAKAV